MDRVGNDIHDACGSGGSEAACLLDDEAHRGALIEESEFTVGVLCVSGVSEDASVHDSAVDISHQRANVSRRVFIPRLIVTGLEVRDVLLQYGIPGRRIGFVERVNLAAGRDLHVRVGQHELSDLRVQSEAVDTMTCGQYHHARRGIHTVARDDEVGAWLHGIIQACQFGLVDLTLPVAGETSCILNENSENGTSGNTSVDVGTAVKWVENCNIIARVNFVDHYRLILLFRRDDAHLARVTEGVFQDLVGHDVEFFLFLALDIDRAASFFKTCEV